MENEYKMEVNPLSLSAMEVYWQNEVELDLDIELMYIKSGQAEIQQYVENTVKPNIEDYVKGETYQKVEKQVDEVVKAQMDDYVENLTKPDIDSYITENVKPYADTAVESANKAAANEQNALTSANSAEVSANNARISEINAQAALERLGTVIKIKGRVNTNDDLPLTGNLDGDTYLVGEDGQNSYPEYYWYQNHWEFLGTSSTSLEWGGIIGTLAKQKDLQNALDGKQNKGDYATNADLENYIPVAGGTMTGNLTLNKNLELSSEVQSHDIGYNWDNGDGAGMALRSKNYAGAPSEAGAFVMWARKTTGVNAQYKLVGKCDGTLSWNNSYILTETTGYTQTQVNSYLDDKANNSLDNLSSAGNAYIDNRAISNINSKFQVVSALPSSPESDVFYFVKES